MADQVTICNMGIELVGGNRIDDIDSTDQKESIVCKDNWDNAIDTVLEKAEWTFATKRASLSPLTSTPAFQYDYQFNVPSDCLRVLEVAAQEDMSDDLDWVREGNKILCNAELVYTRYTMRLRDTSQFSGLFTASLAMEIGSRLAIPIARSKELRASLEKSSQALADEASNKETQQGYMRLIKNFKLINVR